MAFSSILQSDTSSQIDVELYVDAKQKILVSVVGKKGISGWLFDVQKDQVLTHTAEMSEHYTEQGSFLNDTRILKPAQIVLNGFIGELVYRAPQPGSAEYALQQAQSKLLAVNAYLGPLTQGATQKLAAVYAQASYVYDQIGAIAKRAKNVLDYFSGDEAVMNEQQKAYVKLYTLYATGQLVEVQTPWRFFPKMQIVNIVARQDETTTDYTDFSITLQEYRTAGVLVTNFDSNLFPPAETAQSQDVTDQGKVAGKAEDSSLLYKIVGGK